MYSDIQNDWILTNHDCVIGWWQTTQYHLLKEQTKYKDERATIWQSQSNKMQRRVRAAGYLIVIQNEKQTNCCLGTVAGKRIQTFALCLNSGQIKLGIRFIRCFFWVSSLNAPMFIVKPLTIQTLISVLTDIVVWQSRPPSKANKIITIFMWMHCKYEPRHDKANKISLRPAKTRISLGIHSVWSVFTVRMKKAWVLSYPLSAQRRLWSD